MQSQILFIPEGFNCPISQTIMKDPVVTVDGHTFERNAIEQWFNRGNNINPLTGLPLQKLTLIPNLALKDVIQEIVPWIKEKEKEKKNFQKTLKQLEKMWVKETQLLGDMEKGQKKIQNVEQVKLHQKQPEESLLSTLQNEMNEFAFTFSKWQSKSKELKERDEEIGLYKGEIKNKLRHGKGVIKFKNYLLGEKSVYHHMINHQIFSGDVYKGQFANGNQQGKGIIYYKNGQIFYCQWKKNRPDGIGLRIRDKTKIVQIWQDGVAVVQGV